MGSMGSLDVPEAKLDATTLGAKIKGERGAKK
jgi:hypothetical protein